MVTGLVVNSKVNVSRRYIKELRNLLYIWEHYGYEDAAESFRFHYLHVSRKIGSSLRGRITREDERRILHSRITKKANMYSPRLDQHISGQLNFLKMVRGENDYQYLRLSEKFNNLSNKLYYNNVKKVTWSFDSISYFEYSLCVSVLTDEIKIENDTHFFNTNNGGIAVISKKVISFLSSIDQEYYSVAMSLIKKHCRVKAINLEANRYLIWATDYDLKKYHWSIVKAVYCSARDRYQSINSLPDAERSELESLHKDFQFAMNNGNYGMIQPYLHICDFLHLDSGLYPEDFENLPSDEKSVLLQKWGWYYYSLGIDIVPTDKDGSPISESTYDDYRRKWGENFAKLCWEGAEGLALVAGTNNKYVIEVLENKKNAEDVMRILRKHNARKVFYFREPKPLFLIEEDVLPEKKYRSFILHKSGYFPILPYKGETMESLNLSE